MKNSSSHPFLTLQLHPMNEIHINPLVNSVIPSSLPSKVHNHKILLRNRQRNKRVHEWLASPKQNFSQKTLPDSHRPFLAHYQPQNSTPNGDYKPLIGSRMPVKSTFFISQTQRDGLITPEIDPIRKPTQTFDRSAFQRTTTSNFFKTNADFEGPDPSQAGYSLYSGSRIHSALRSTRGNDFRQSTASPNKYQLDTTDHFLIPQLMTAASPREGSEYVKDFFPASYRSLPSSVYFNGNNREITKENPFTHQALALKKPLIFKEEDSKQILNVKPAKILENKPQESQKSTHSGRWLKSSARTHRKTSSVPNINATPLVHPKIHMQHIFTQEKPNRNQKVSVGTSYSLENSPKQEAATKEFLFETQNPKMAEEEFVKQNPIRPKTGNAPLSSGSIYVINTEGSIENLTSSVTTSREFIPKRAKKTKLHSSSATISKSQNKTFLIPKII